jgi:hypothetical protein
MTDDNKHDDKDRKKLSDEEMKDVAGGFRATVDEPFQVRRAGGDKKDKKRADSGTIDHNSSRSNNG